MSNNKDIPKFLSSDEILINILHTCFYSGDLAPDILSKATGVNIDLCINFMSEVFALIVCDEYENVGQNKKPKKRQKSEEKAKMHNL